MRVNIAATDETLMKKFLLLLIISLPAMALDYPLGPHPKLTPGSLCDTPDSYRYKERIAYCERDVSRDSKDHIFRNYERLGYRFKPNERSSFKIDHYIPLCAGGSNYDNNLWPQHISVYKQTDAIEALGCEKLRDGKLTQRQLVQLIKEVKNDLSLAREYLRELQSK